MGKKRKWKDVTPEDPSSILVGSGEGGFVSLEEIDEDFVFGDLGEEVLTGADDEGEAGDRGFKKKKKKRKKRSRQNGVPQSEVVPEGREEKKCKTATEDQNADEQTTLEEHVEQDADISEWKDLRIHPLLLKAIAALGFKCPTPIQRACIPAAAHKGKDVIGAAETGSGKTLAFGIPILQRLLDEREKLLRLNDDTVPPTGSSLRALIITPTRELALQICDHIRAVAKFTDIKIAPIVGGMSMQKQERVLKQMPAIVVGTPGRLWELMSSSGKHLVELEELSFFVLDEADRMIEKGHFQELQSIIDLLPKTKRQEKTQETDLAENLVPFAKKRRQTLVFSATLALPPDFKKKLKRGYVTIKPSSQYSVAVLSERAGISHNSEIVNLTSKNVVAEKLSEAVIECTEEEKDVYLYYVLKVHGCGRTIVFCTSIAAVRRLAAILRLLEVPSWPLHAQQQQRQRLKTMDRFRSSSDGVLVATDVAARGLDIPGVRTVIHYQLPHSAEMYVHRSGRTARADKDGCSIALISSTEKTKYLPLCSALSKSSGFTSFPVDLAYKPSVAKRVSLAVKIDKILRQHSQTKAKTTWFEQHAKELEIDLEDKNDGNDDRNDRQSLQVKTLQEELKQLLRQPLERKGFSRRYATGAGLSALAAQQLQEYVAKPGQSRLVVIGKEEMEPLQALKAAKSE